MILAMFAIAAPALTGCLESKGNLSAETREVPSPLDQYLPVSLKVHSFTRIGEFETGNYGLEAYIQAIDSWGEPTKAFGDFRFELYEFRPFHQEKKGRQIEMWQVHVEQVTENRNYWHHHTRSYQFLLGMSRRIPVHQKLILRVIFNNPFSERMILEEMIAHGR
jgi:hypothetical protein